MTVCFRPLGCETSGLECRLVYLYLFEMRVKVHIYCPGKVPLQKSVGTSRGEKLMVSRFSLEWSSDEHDKERDYVFSEVL